MAVVALAGAMVYAGARAVVFRERVTEIMAREKQSIIHL